MQARHHIIISVSIGIALYAIFRSAALSISAMVTGIFIDLDHVFDYFREYGLRLDLKHFFYVFYETLFKRIVLPLHSWELVIILGIMAAMLDWNPIVTGTVIGAGGHLIADQIYNKGNLFAYLFLYRVIHNFKTSKIFPGKGID
jgi:hypothetical protein